MRVNRPYLSVVMGTTIAAGVALRELPWPGGWVLVLHAAIWGALAGALVVAWWARRQFFVVFLVWIGSLLHFFLAPSAPSVTLVVIDCWRADLLNPEDTPNLLRLSESAWNFEQARATSSWTRSSMPSLLSGRPPVEHGLYRVSPPDKIRPNVRLAAEIFRESGWYTAAFLEQAQLAAAFGYARGYRHFDFHAGMAPALGSSLLRWHRIFRLIPRFVQVHLIDIHGPYTVGKRWLPKGTPKTALKLAPSKVWRQTIQQVRSGEITPTAEDWEALRNHQRGELRQLDAQLGAWWKTWEADGTLDNGWLVVTGDHGEQFGEHGQIEHLGTPYDVLLRVPLIIRPPGGGATRSERSVSLMDVLPTLLHGVGLPVPAEVYGQDLGPVSQRETMPERPYFAEEHAGKVHHAAVWWGGYKLIRGRHTFLYNLVDDPKEEQNLAESLPEKRAELEGVLAGYFRAAAEGRPIAEVDWAAEARSGAVWTPQELTTEAANPDAGTMKALEALGYLDGLEEE
ncbi:MAG TPA: sulfatase-like hydrolase/transferase [Myxococcota bacterium]|nr:sulfatase-like hydrolase/transferase [Myxococcota bacterium]